MRALEIIFKAATSKTSLEQTVFDEALTMNNSTSRSDSLEAPSSTLSSFCSKNFDNVEIDNNGQLLDTNSHNGGCSTDSSSNGSSGSSNDMTAAIDMVGAKWELEIDDEGPFHPNRSRNDTLQTLMQRNDTLSSLIPGPTGPVLGESDLFYIPVRATAAMGLPSPPIDFKRQRYERNHHHRFLSLFILSSYLPLTVSFSFIK